MGLSECKLKLATGHVASVLSRSLIKKLPFWKSWDWCFWSNLWQTSRRCYSLILLSGESNSGNCGTSVAILRRRSIGIRCALSHHQKSNCSSAGSPTRNFSSWRKSRQRRRRRRRLPTRKRKRRSHLQSSVAMVNRTTIATTRSIVDSTLKILISHNLLAQIDRSPVFLCHVRTPPHHYPSKQESNRFIAFVVDRNGLCYSFSLDWTKLRSKECEWNTLLLLNFYDFTDKVRGVHISERFFPVSHSKNFPICWYFLCVAFC